MAELSYDTMQQYIPQILAAMPQDWRGTTFNNTALLSRAGFAERLQALISSKAASKGTITTEELVAVGNAEDYLRVASNISTTLEIALSLRKKLNVTQVFTFSSVKMPYVAVALATGKKVHIYTGSESSPFNGEHLKVLALIGCVIEVHSGAASTSHDGEVVLSVESALDAASPGVVDGVVAPHILMIRNCDVIDESKVLVVRKRMNTPTTTPMAEAMLQEIAGIEVTSNQGEASNDAIAEFYAHLQTMSGTPVDTDSKPIVCAVGLATLCSLWVTLVKRGGVDILMCSTAYGGSSQLVDVLTGSTPTLKKHTFDIQGDLSILDSIRAQLERLAADPSKLMPTTVLFVEIPTNPDMKVPDLSSLADILRPYIAKTGKKLVLLVDATFAPASNILAKLRALMPELCSVVFLSMSKSVSRGLTTSGCLIPNHTAEAVSLIKDVWNTADMLDTHARPDQMLVLTKNHTGVEDRCQRAYTVAHAIASCLQESVQKYRGEKMRLAFVTPEQAAQGLTTSTFSINLPPPEHSSDAERAALAQKFVDLLTVHDAVKPCVSFGQDNDLVYATVPATSTQGAIKEEDKAKQAIGGVQLVRLSFSPGCNVEKLKVIFEEAVKRIYE